MLVATAILLTRLVIQTLVTLRLGNALVSQERSVAHVHDVLLDSACIPDNVLVIALVEHILILLVLVLTVAVICMEAMVLLVYQMASVIACQVGLVLNATRVSQIITKMEPLACHAIVVQVQLLPLVQALVFVLV